MAEDMNIDELVETFKQRGISCKDLKRREEQRLKLAKEARKDGFESTAKMDEQVASKIRSVRRSVCKLK